ncbi:MAG: uracil-DNA glycosylase family 4 [Phycisphaerales bacterium]
MPATLDERAIRLIRQHAATSRLLGVGFVPVSPIAPAISAAIAPAAPAASDVSWAMAPPVSRQVEPKPKSRPTPASPAPAGSSAPAVVYSPIEIPSGELAPKKAQALLDEVCGRYEADAPHQYFATDHHNIVFGEGDPRARLMFVGEAPGEQEDLQGRPFVGRSGQLLEKMIIAMGLSRETVYIANVLKTRPPNNQTPTVEEAQLCAGYLFDQIRIIRPEVIVTLGLPASRLLLGTKEPMRAIRGSFRQFPSGSGEDIFARLGQAWEGEPVPVMPTYHPAYLLRSYTAENRKKVWGDLKQVMDRLGLIAKA